MNTRPAAVLITDGLTGIGRATALAFAHEGATNVLGTLLALKHAVEGLTKSAALEGAAASVRVNAVAPGPVQTDMLERYTGGNEAAKNGFLASDKARFLTGQCLAVDGGYTAQ